ncbi:MAG: hypothetical protein MRY57_04085 [Candidatus Pacebacteria bacterium]|nr:hypothetical protein [Candidatus Paceibacterota bacterium]
MKEQQPKNTFFPNLSDDELIKEYQKILGVMKLAKEHNKKIPLNEIKRRTDLSKELEKRKINSNTLISKKDFSDMKKKYPYKNVSSERLNELSTNIIDAGIRVNSKGESSFEKITGEKTTLNTTMEKPKKNNESKKAKKVDPNDRILELENMMRDAEDNNNEKAYLKAESERKEIRQSIIEKKIHKAEKNVQKIEKNIAKIQKKIDSIPEENAKKHELLVEKAKLEQKRFGAQMILNQEQQNDARITEEQSSDAPDPHILEQLEKNNTGLDAVSSQLAEDSHEDHVWETMDEIHNGEDSSDKESKNNLGEDEKIARELEQEHAGNYRAQAQEDFGKTPSLEKEQESDPKKRDEYVKSFEKEQAAQETKIIIGEGEEKYIHIDQGKLFNLRKKERDGDITEYERKELEVLDTKDKESRKKYNELRDKEKEGTLNDDERKLLMAITAYRDKSAERLNNIKKDIYEKKDSTNENKVDQIETEKEKRDRINAEMRKDHEENPEKYKVYNESRKLESQEESGRSSKHLDILQRRRANAMEREKALNQFATHKIDKGELTRLLGPEYIQRLKESKGNNWNDPSVLKQEAMMQREKIGTLERRIGKTERQISRYKNRNENWFKKAGARIGIARKQFGRWFENPQNKKKLLRRVAVTTLAATGAAFVLPGASILGVGAAMTSLAGGYAGGETARKLYNFWLRKNNKDYRQQMADIRSERGSIIMNPTPENATSGTAFSRLGQRGPRVEKVSSAWIDYQARLDGMAEKIVKKQNTWRKVWDTTGRMVGAFSARGVFNEFFPKDIEIPDTTPDTTPDITPEPVDPTPPTPEPKESFISKDAFINKGEGITHALKRQLINNPEIAQKLGVRGNPTANDLARIAKDFGYINEDGSDVRVFMGKGAAYELTLDKHGNPIVREHIGGRVEGDNYVGENTFQEKHLYGKSPFEGGSHEGRGMGTGEYEYIEKGGNSNNNGFNPDTIKPDTNNDGFNPDDADVIEKNSKVRTLRTYPGHRMVVNNMFDAKFGNMHTDRSVMELFNANGVAFNQKNFEMLGWRLAENADGAKTFININDTGANLDKLYSWQDIYEQTDFKNINTRFPNLEMLENTNTGFNPDNTGNTGGFNPDNAETLETNTNELKETFKQTTGHFTVTHYENGSPKISFDPNYRFDGEMQTGDFTGREQRLLEKGKFEAFEGMPPQAAIPELGLNNAGIIKLKNGQYVFQNIIGTQNPASGLEAGKQQLDTAMRMLGMPNHVEHTITDSAPIKGTNIYRTRVFTPISEDQARYIGKIYTEIRRYTGMNN